MERKIGEIFEYNGEWYQCIPDNTDDNCNNCFFQKSCSDITGDCSSTARSDGKSVAFKKLEKVGEPYRYMDGIYQQYRVYSNPYFPDVWHTPTTNGFAVKIKQTKEDMEEKNNGNTPLNVLTDKYVNGDICYDDFEKEVKALYSCKEEIKPTLKEFDLEAAKAGKPVCTRDGRKARIICFDAKFPKTGNIVTLVEKENGEEVTLYHYDDGHCSIGRGYDLMMLPEKKEGWVNIYALNTCYSSKEEAKANIDRDYEHEYIRTVKIEWEE